VCIDRGCDLGGLCARSWRQSWSNILNEQFLFSAHDSFKIMESIEGKLIKYNFLLKFIISPRDGHSKYLLQAPKFLPAALFINSKELLETECIAYCHSVMMYGIIFLDNVRQ